MISKELNPRAEARIETTSRRYTKKAINEEPATIVSTSFNTMKSSFVDFDFL
ncbi:hypothetical protein [Paenibacillus sp. sgz5001063]|uniref:hypothetical protein n=1 Tax=Paenibacillus sp. sgz5001063 TaxID=3242474 RepID=UPI0036D3DA2B